ncbi:MAG: argininosuccinate lyase, partial [Chloroflexia bacterium]|nr:argininosuccinate lyase [Chloroflexia bacterium]
VYGDATTVGTMVHSAAFGDTNDVEDPIYVPLDRAFDAATAVLELLTAVLESVTFDTRLMAERAQGGAMTTTALADALVESVGLPFRTAHTIVSRAVSRGGTITAEVVNEIGSEVIGRELAVSDSFVREALDVERFIARRTLPGGPAPEATRAAIAAAFERLDANQGMLREGVDRLERAETERRERASAILARDP